MPDHDLDALALAAARRRRLPLNATCATCGTSQHLKQTADGSILCYGCRVRERGRTDVEEDHPAGRVNLGGVIVRLRANDHRTVTELRTRLGMDDWPKANDDPLVVLAHLLGGVATLLWLFAEWLLEVAVDATSRLGPDGWAGVRPAPCVP